MKKAADRRPQAGGETFVLLGRDGERFSFACSSVVEGVAVNPELPDDFSDLANERRPGRHLAWAHIPYIEIEISTDPQFVKHWKGRKRYDVRCLDFGCWDRPTCWGMFGTLAEAVECCRKGPSWLSSHTEGTKRGVAA